LRRDGETKKKNKRFLGNPPAEHGEEASSLPVSAERQADDCDGDTNGTTKKVSMGGRKEKQVVRKEKRKAYVLCFFQVAFCGLWLCK
jgi:hypothetical protein